MPQFRKYLTGLIAASAIGAAPAARADDWACTVLLCMLNPAGPMAVAACVPPIKKLWRELAKGKAFPTCSGADNAQSRLATTSETWCHPSLLVQNEQATANMRCTAATSLEIFLDGKPQARAWFDIENRPNAVVTEFLGESADAGRK